MNVSLSRLGLGLGRCSFPGCIRLSLKTPSSIGLLRLQKEQKAHLHSGVFIKRNRNTIRTPNTILRASTRRMASTVTVNPPRDPNTLSNYNNFRSTHVTANFDILFDQQRLVGNVVHQLKSITNAESQEIVLDTSFLDIDEVKVDGKAAKWDLLPRMEPFGSALKIQLDQGVGFDKTVEVDISLKTTKECTALQWLTPEQTSNKKHPYLFSQCQAIHARSIFPCQDTPDVKSTYDFNLKSPLPVIASGLSIKGNQAADGSGRRLYQFQQKVPIPSYLFAIASGDIVEAPIGPRSVVATSPDKLEECKWELEADTENYMNAIEKIVFPYAWGQYNVLILPPSFPYGGMENPVYTFATPSIISKDRENVDVIAHELSHSWSGNLVTNASWEHFWLNEGWTIYLERRILASIHGEPYRHFSAIIGWKALTDSIERYGVDHEFTKLVTDLKGKDPDDAFSSIPYEKGFNFVFYLEQLIGQEKFDKFIPHYFTTFKGKSLDSYEFKSTILDFFATDAEATGLLSTVDWEAWFYAPGFPPKPKFDTSLVDIVYDLGRKWQKFTTDPSSTFTPSESDVKGLTSNQILVFLEQILLLEKPLTPEQSQLMGKLYGFAASHNMEVTNLYCQVALKGGDRGIIDTTVNFVGNIGRMKLVRPLYRGLQNLDAKIANETFEKNRDFYHPICRAMIEKDLYGEKK